MTAQWMAELKSELVLPGLVIDDRDDGVFGFARRDDGTGINFSIPDWLIGQWGGKVATVASFIKGIFVGK